MPEMERAYRKYQNGQVWAHGITEYCLYSSLNFRKIKRICMENVAGWRTRPCSPTTFPIQLFLFF